MRSTLILYRLSLEGLGCAYVLDKYTKTSSKSIKRIDFPWNISPAYMASFSQIYICDYYPSLSVFEHALRINPHIKFTVLYRTIGQHVMPYTDDNKIELIPAFNVSLVSAARTLAFHVNEYTHDEMAILDMICRYEQGAYVETTSGLHIPLFLSHVSNYDEFLGKFKNYSLNELVRLGEQFYAEFYREYNRSLAFLHEAIFGDYKGYALNTMFMPNYMVRQLALKALMSGDHTFGMVYHYAKNKAMHVYLSTKCPHRCKLLELVEPYSAYGSDTDMFFVSNNLHMTLL